jgi:5-methyltetrahydropteroyltriglutamate--homocysteine methyltransferase
VIDDAAGSRRTVRADLDVISDGEQTRLDFNLSFYGFLEGIEREAVPVRRWGPAAHDQRGKHKVIGDIKAKTGLGAVREYQRLVKLAAHTGKVLKCSIPGPYTLSGRLDPNGIYEDRYEVTEALIPIVSHELKPGQSRLRRSRQTSSLRHKTRSGRLVDILYRGGNQNVASLFLQF